MIRKLYVPTELGFFHKAQSGKAHPLVYDFIEWMRPLVVDRTIINIIRKKKRRIDKIDKKFIAYFIFKIKKEFDREYYHKKLHYCITLDYWNDLILLSFIKSVNQKNVFKPLFPSLRHETRCKKSPRKNILR